MTKLVPCVYAIWIGYVKLGALLQGGSWKVVSSFEGALPSRIKQLPLNDLFDLNNVKKVTSNFHTNIVYRTVIFGCTSTLWLVG